jgi:excisionase family DNA binding protein
MQAVIAAKGGVKMDYLTITEAASLIRVSHWTLRAWLSSGRCQRYKVGGRTLVRRQDILGLVKPETAVEAANRNSKRQRSNESKV